MALPETLADLQAAGYVYQSTGTCRGCNALMAWFITPKDKWMPFTRKPESLAGGPKRYEPHHAVCPARDRFSKSRKAHSGRKERDG